MMPTPEQIAEMYSWFLERRYQQISNPLDEASRNVLAAGTDIGAGTSSLTDTITIGAGGGSATVPKAYAGTFIESFGSTRYEIPYISIP